MEDGGPMLHSLGVDEGADASRLGSRCQELVLQEMAGLADVLGYFCASELNRAQIEGCHTTDSFSVSTLVTSLWPGPVITLLDDVQACLEIAWPKTVSNRQYCRDAPL